MGIADLSSVLKILGEAAPSDEELDELYAEALLMTLARASSSDANIDSAEISTIQTIVKRETGEDLTPQDVRRAARTELYETTPLRKYLRNIRRDLRHDDRRKIVQALAEVINSDCKVSVLEIDFFNRVADALRITPAELAGLHD